MAKHLCVANDILLKIKNFLHDAFSSVLINKLHICL